VFSQRTSGAGGAKHVSSALRAPVAAPQSAGAAVLGAVPGMQGVATVVVSSALTGSANAFLTLRVGTLANRGRAVQFTHRTE
jgi:hypothetical protein